MSEEKVPSDYMMKKFLKDFSHPLEFWTGEDGEPASLVVIRTNEGLERLRQELRAKGIDSSDKKLLKRYAFRGRAEDGEFGPTRIVWRTGKTKTPFPVYEVEYF